MTSFDLNELAALLGAKLYGDDDKLISSVASLQRAKSGDICYVADEKYLPLLSETNASAIILDKSLYDKCLPQLPCLVVENAQLSFVKVANYLRDAKKKTGVHETAIIGEECNISPDVFIGAGCVIGDRVEIADNVILEAGCVIQDGVKIGANTLCHPSVTICHEVAIGSDCIFHSGAVIGSDGFGNLQHEGRWLKIPQLGSVVIGDDVEIGANTTIDRGALDDTKIESGVRLDNQVHIAHNVVVGAGTAIAGATVVAGSVSIGRGCMIGGGCCISGHLSIADRTIITGMSAVSKSIEKRGVYSSAHSVQPNRQWNRMLTHYRHIDDLVKRVKKLEEK